MTKQLNSHQFEGVYKDMGIDLDTLGCVMLDVEKLPDMDSMVALSYEEQNNDLHYSKNPDRKWINGWVAGNVAHITLLYGLLDNAHNWEQPINKVLDGWELCAVEIDHIGYFDSPYDDEEYYCLVAHIKVTDELMEGHQRLEFLPHINTFTGYKPHMTICYIKKDVELRDEYIKRFNTMWAGKKLKTKTGINLGYKPKDSTPPATAERKR